jgi:acyl-CoA reductase-like NAD-dependent aldehyde dehydrogenase
MNYDIETQTQPTDAVRSPYDGAVVGYMPIADADAVERSIERAQAAFEIMRQLPRFTRADILQRAADLIESRRDEFVRTIAAESGKPLYDARGEVSRGVFNLRNAAAEARRSHGEEVPLDVDAGVFEYQTTDASGSATELSRLDLDTLADMRRRVGIARRFPIGLILAISPFNFPLNLVLHKVAPAIAAANAAYQPSAAGSHARCGPARRCAGGVSLQYSACGIDGPGRPLRHGDLHGQRQGRLAY